MLCAVRCGTVLCFSAELLLCRGLADACFLRRTAAGRPQLSHTQTRVAALPLVRLCRSQFEVDFNSLSYCNSEDDVLAARGVLDSLGMASTKIIAKVGAG